jgi:DNA-directed RNA polymerase specialized sigma24 family protein
MTDTLENRERALAKQSGSDACRSGSGLNQPVEFQLTLLRASALRQADRAIFLLKEVQGCTFAEIAAILGISIDTAQARFERARREFMHLGDSDARERKQ